ncbi:hypothetical protein [Streptomyces sp. NPDC006510]|uniref:hypothetical protein n=1 Tax=Streptomyces sp. NPDC006510 TaxID=3155600 RepID=UPI0033BE810C
MRTGSGLPEDAVGRDRPLTDIAIRRFAERDHNISRWTELERGGNFLVLEQPEASVTDVRAFFGSLDA